MNLAFGGWPVRYDTATEALQFYLLVSSSRLTLWEGNRANFLLMRRRFPRYDQTGHRLVLQTLDERRHSRPSPRWFSTRPTS